MGMLAWQPHNIYIEHLPDPSAGFLRINSWDFSVQKNIFYPHLIATLLVKHCVKNTLYWSFLENSCNSFCY